ncbi:MAG: PHP domain-containing protein [Firmicutes bacterium]|nr:PHP domain-containing protein [Bacillota bacterium]
MDKWRMTFDLHTHTCLVRNGKVITHAVSTMEEVVLSAREKGLKKIGISNHGPGHVTYGLPLESVADLKKERDRLQTLYGDIEILIGVEANIINRSGLLDVRPEELAQFDYILAGYHYGIFGEQPVGAAVLHGRNWIWETTGRRMRNPGLRSDNTQRMVEAIMKNRPLAVTHPGDKAPTDIEAVARACEETGTWMEINNFHKDLTVENLKLAAKFDVKFVIGSDAHKPERVGCFEEGLKRLLEAGVDPERVVNLERM